MAQCSEVRDRFADLLLGSIESADRENALLHIEGCPSCNREWAENRRVWDLLGDIPDVPLPDRVRANFQADLDREFGRPRSNVLVFDSRKAVQWLSRAAAFILIVGSSFVAGRQFAPQRSLPMESATIQSIEPMSVSIAERLTVPASRVNPEILGSPEIRNLNVLAANESGEIEVTFDLTSSMTITGRPEDKALVQLLAYVVQSQDNPTHSRSRVIQLVRDTYGTKGIADPEIVRAIAFVLANDTHEGVRIKAVDALRNLPQELVPEARSALLKALRTDPNPAVRMKAVEALANLATTATEVDPETLDILREKAAQHDENPYVRVKAAEALSQIDL